jgi:hypothetical protein
MEGAKSTFTLRIGSIIRPELVKKRETFSPRSARRAISSGEVSLRILRICFIKLLLLLGGFPQGHKMVILAFSVFPNLEDDAVEAIFHPADGSVLFRNIRALVEVIRVRKDFLRLLKADPTLGIRSQPPAFSRIEVESHEV